MDELAGKEEIWNFKDELVACLVHKLNWLKLDQLIYFALFTQNQKTLTHAIKTL
jgi:hypothetical protein